MPRKCAIFGVACPALTTQVNYLIDEAVATSKGANAVISYLHHFLETFGMKEKKLVLHADNCSGQNKNNAMMGYLLWRVATGRNTSVEMNFLVAGHTKFSCDQHFGYLKKKTRRTRLSCLKDIVNAVESSAKGNMAQLVGSEDGEVKVKVYDWTSFLVVRKIVGIKKHHQFLMNADTLGLVTMKIYSDSVETVAHRMFDAVPENMPAVVLPEGLSVKRKVYLAKEIREFCTPETRDLVCPITAMQSDAEEGSDGDAEHVPRRKKTKN